ncbi:MAG: sodium/proton-translocating pyrophosphatase, partial [Planctomycetes bacterium]|nr:sodium/proton-translocating pyrophosphatase [Planctomycetota bacterium]
MAFYAWLLTPVGALVALCAAVLFYAWMKKKDEGTDVMKKIAGHVRKGARAYLFRQYRVVSVVFVIVALFFGLLAYLGTLPVLVPFAFLTGGFFSGLAGWIGM